MAETNKQFFLIETSMYNFDINVYKKTRSTCECHITFMVSSASCFKASLCLDLSWSYKTFNTHLST